MSEFLVIVPAFNEESSIGSVIEGINKNAPDADIVVIDDASTDKTRYIANQKGADVISHTFNLGYGGALQTGFRLAVKRGYDFVVTIDADNQHDPECIRTLVKAKLATDADMVIGSRFISGDVFNVGILKKIGIFMLSRITRFYTGVTITDPTSGYQLLSRNVYSFLARGDNYPLDYPDANIIMLLHKKRFKIVETQVKMYERRIGSSMHSGFKPVLYVIKMFLAIIMVILRRS